MTGDLGDKYGFTEDGGKKINSFRSIKVRFDTRFRHKRNHGPTQPKPNQHKNIDNRERLFLRLRFATKIGES